MDSGQNEARDREIAGPAAKPDAATRTVAALGGNCDRWRTAFESLAEAVESACAFDGGEALPESSPWAAALDRLDTALGEIRDAVKAVVS